ncbi:MAG: HAD-IA family hydrolase [Bacteroidaceae bacterium]|nr:HAD-IA family hydrolase [Bacteroidaceae bacterium]
MNVRKHYLESHGFEGFHLKAVLFDMDGVLFDSMPKHAECWYKAMNHFGFQFERYEAFLHEGRTGAGTINIISQRQRGHDMSPEEIREIYKYKSDLFNQMEEAAPMPGAAEVLEKVIASGLTPILVTGSAQDSLLGRLKQHYPGVFAPELMVTANDVKYGKPHPEPYLIGLEKGKVQPWEAIVVENAPLGVESSTQANIFTLAVNTGPLEDQILWNAGANMLFGSMQELADQWEDTFNGFQGW